MENVDIDTKLGSMSQIQEFFKDSSVFITGATGFLGHVLLSKLLRSCPDINKIYVLLREKRGKTAMDRFKEMLEDEVFQVIKSDCPDILSKVTPIVGDCIKPGLGISEVDRELIKKEVNVVFHVAATVRFDAPLRQAVNMNIRSTSDLLDLAVDMKNLKSGRHRDEERDRRSPRRDREREDRDRRRRSHSRSPRRHDRSQPEMTLEQALQRQRELENQIAEMRRQQQNREAAESERGNVPAQANYSNSNQRPPRPDNAHLLPYPPPKNCFQCGRPSHYVWECPTYDQGVVCYNCYKPGHRARECRERDYNYEYRRDSRHSRYYDSEHRRYHSSSSRPYNNSAERRRDNEYRSEHRQQSNSRYDSRQGGSSVPDQRSNNNDSNHDLNQRSIPQNNSSTSHDSSTRSINQPQSSITNDSSQRSIIPPASVPQPASTAVVPAINNVQAQVNVVIPSTSNQTPTKPLNADFADTIRHVDYVLAQQQAFRSWKLPIIEPAEMGLEEVSEYLSKIARIEESVAWTRKRLEHRLKQFELEFSAPPPSPAPTRPNPVYFQNLEQQLALGPPVSTPAFGVQHEFRPPPPPPPRNENKPSSSAFRPLHPSSNIRYNQPNFVQMVKNSANQQILANQMSTLKVSPQRSNTNNSAKRPSPATIHPDDPRAKKLKNTPPPMKKISEHKGYNPRDIAEPPNKKGPAHAVDDPTKRKPTIPSPLDRRIQNGKNKSNIQVTIPNPSVSIECMDIDKPSTSSQSLLEDQWKNVKNLMPQTENWEEEIQETPVLPEQRIRSNFQSITGEHLCYIYEVIRAMFESMVDDRETAATNAKDEGLDEDMDIEVNNERERLKERELALVAKAREAESAMVSASIEPMELEDQIQALELVVEVVEAWDLKLPQDVNPRHCLNRLALEGMDDRTRKAFKKKQQLKRKKEFEKAKKNQDDGFDDNFRQYRKDNDSPPPSSMTVGEMILQNRSSV